jgi:DNA-binding CsgD family transcriptional regulator
MDSLRAALQADVPPFYRVAGLTKKEARIVGALVEVEGAASREAMCDALGMSGSVFWAHMTHIRRKLKPHGIEIKTHKCVGLEIAEADKRKLEQCKRM